MESVRMSRVTQGEDIRTKEDIRRWSVYMEPVQEEEGGRTFEIGWLER